MTYGNLSNMSCEFEFEEDIDELTFIEGRELKRFQEDWDL